MPTHASRSLPASVSATLLRATLLLSLALFGMGRAAQADEEGRTDGSAEEMIADFSEGSVLEGPELLGEALEAYKIRGRGGAWSDKVLKFVKGGRVTGLMSKASRVGEVFNIVPKMKTAYQYGGVLGVGGILGFMVASYGTSTGAGLAAASALMPAAAVPIVGPAIPIAGGFAVASGVALWWEDRQQDYLAGLREQAGRPPPSPVAEMRADGPKLTTSATLYAVSLQKWVNAVTDAAKRMGRGGPAALPPAPSKTAVTLSVGTKVERLATDRRPLQMAGARIPGIVVQYRVRVLSGKHRGRVGWLLKGADVDRTWYVGPFATFGY